MSKETKEQREQREHYEKLIIDAIAIGPIKFKDVTPQLREFYAWKYCQVAHVEDAMGGWANFRYFLTEHGEAYFKMFEQKNARIRELEEIIKENEGGHDE